MENCSCSLRSVLLVLAMLLLGLVVTSSVAYGDKPAPPWLGLGIEKGARGVRVREVLPDSPCAGADVHPGDEVLSLGPTVVTLPAQLVAAVQQAGVDHKVVLSLLSPQGKERKVAVVLGPRPSLDDLQRNTLVGRPAPDFTPRVLSGPAMPSLGKLRGEVVLLDFFASWCGPCMRALPELSSLHSRYAGRGLRVVGVSAETPEILGRVIREHGLKYTVAMDVDEQATRAYRVYALPTLVVLDRKGTVRTVALSDLDEAVKQIEIALGEPPAGPLPRQQPGSR